MFPSRGFVGVVHAHPDDETLATGPLLLWLARRGLRVGVLTCTRGERGGVVKGPLSSLAGTPELAEHRQRELAAALSLLRVTDHAFLGTPPARAAGLGPRVYEDSGMEWITEHVAGPGPDAGPLAFVNAPVAEAAADVAAWASASAANLLVSYDSDGGYHHPDHVHAHHVTKAAAELLGVPFLQVVSEPRDLPFGSVARPGTVTIEAEDDWASIEAAHRAHASQFTLDGDEVVHHGGQREPVVHRVRVARG